MVQREKIRDLQLTAYENFNLECENITIPLKSYFYETQRLVKVIAGKNIIEQISEFEFRFHMKTLNFINIYHFQPIVTIKVLPDGQGAVSFESQNFEIIGINYINHNFNKHRAYCYVGDPSNLKIENILTVEEFKTKHGL